MDSDETVLGRGRYGTHESGYRAMVRAVRHWPERTWAIEGCQGIGGHIDRRLLADGEQVVDVPPKLSARTRVFTTGQGRKTDATDAHSIALAATRMVARLRPVADWSTTGSVDTTSSGTMVYEEQTGHGSGPQEVHPGIQGRGC